MTKLNALVQGTRNRRTIIRAMFGVVAGIAFYASYWHLVAVGLWAGQDTISAHLTPIMVDALVLLSTMTIFNNRTLRTHRSTWAWTTQGFGLLATVGGNMLDALIHTSAAPVTARLIYAGWPAVALFLSTKTALFDGRESSTVSKSAVVTPSAPITPRKPAAGKPVAVAATPKPKRGRPPRQVAPTPVTAVARTATPTGWPAVQVA